MGAAGAAVGACCPPAHVASSRAAADLTKRKRDLSQLILRTKKGLRAVGRAASLCHARIPYATHDKSLGGNDPFASADTLDFASINASELDIASVAHRFNLCAKHGM